MDAATIRQLKHLCHFAPPEFVNRLASCSIFYCNSSNSPLLSFSEPERSDIAFSVIDNEKLRLPFENLTVIFCDECQDGYLRITNYEGFDSTEPEHQFHVLSNVDFTSPPQKTEMTGFMFALDAQALAQRKVRYQMIGGLCRNEWKPWGTAKPDMRDDRLASECTADFIAAASCFTLPVGYRFKVHPEGRFTGRNRRILDFSIYRCLTPNRVRTEFKGSRHGDDGEGDCVTPHARCGHWRRQWKRAGINRIMLPADVVSRHQLEVQHKVPKSWIPETWVGPRVFRSGPVRYEVAESIQPNAHKKFDLRLVSIDREFSLKSITLGAGTPA